MMADLLSRSNQVQSTEWSLHPQVFKQICLKWFTPHVDVFATRLNHKVPLYVSPVPGLEPSAALNRDPTSTSSVKISSQTVPQLCVPQHLNLHAWCLGVDNSKNKASLWKWQRELLPLRDRQQGPSTSQSGPYLRDGAEKIRWISPLPL